MPDRPFADPRDGKPIMAKPNLNMVGRTAGSPDNAQGTHFFLINDTGTYFLRKLPPPTDESASVFDEETLLARAAEAKVKLLDHRIDVPGGNRDFPAYLDSNRFLSNLPGTTILFPVVDLSRQYINGMMYLLTQPEGARPTVVDDRNFYRTAGVKKWVRVRLPEQGHQGPARRHLGDAHADRGRPAAAEPDADRRRHGARCVDPRLDRAARPAGRPEVPQAVRSDARLRLEHPSVEAPRHPALARAAAEVRQRAGDLRRAPAQGRAPHQGDVPAQLRQHGRSRRRRRRRQVRPEGHLLGRRRCSSASTEASSAPSTSRRPATTRPTSSPARGTSAPTSTKHMAASRRIATRSTCPGSGCRHTTWRTRTTRSTSAAG